MPTARKLSTMPEVEKREGGWVVLHSRSSGLLANYFVNEHDAKGFAKNLAEKLQGSNEFVVVQSVSEAYFPKT